MKGQPLRHTAHRYNTVKEEQVQLRQTTTSTLDHAPHTYHTQHSYTSCLYFISHSLWLHTRTHTSHSLRLRHTLVPVCLVHTCALTSPTSRNIILILPCPFGHTSTWTHLNMDTPPHGHTPPWAHPHLDTPPSGHTPTWVHPHTGTPPHGHIQTQAHPPHKHIPMHSSHYHPDVLGPSSYVTIVFLATYCSLTKECPWVVRLTCPSKWGVGSVLRIFTMKEHSCLWSILMHCQFSFAALHSRCGMLLS